MVEFSPNAETIRRRLVGMSVIGRADVAELTNVELGTLAALVWRPESCEPGNLASEVFEALREANPVFDEDSAVAALESLGESAAEPVIDSTPGVLRWIEEAAAKVILGCGAGLTPRVRSGLSSLVQHGFHEARRAMADALRSCVGETSADDADALVARERSFLCALEDPRDRIVMARVCDAWTYGDDDEVSTPRGADPLALLPGYLDLASRIVRDALEHVRSIQDGRTPYVADKAFTVGGAQVVMRALQAGLDQDVAWALDAAGPLFAGVAVAPGSKAKTVPSQSAATAFAKAIAERPAVRVVAQMKRTLGEIRHAGVKKKAARFAKTAERRLLERDDFLVEMDPSVEVPKSLESAIVRAFEVLLVRTEPMAFERFERLLGHDVLGRVASGLVWIVGGVAVVPVREGGRWMFVGADGETVEAVRGAVSLWHPFDGEVDAWRRIVLDRGIAQPFNQVFRETYSEASLQWFVGVDLDVRTLLGLARSQGWVLREGGVLVRRVGDLRTHVTIDSVFPGATGITRCWAVDIFAQGREPASIGDRDPRIVSECIRGIDLLVGVSAFAVASEREMGTARARVEVLSRMIGDDPAAGAHVDGRYVRIGDVAISIATGVVRRGGAEIEVPPRGGVTVLPYPDEVLRRIVMAVNGLAHE